MKKSLAELIAELQKIPNPEKVGVAFLTDDQYELIDKAYDASEISTFNVLYDGDIVQAKAQGFESVVTF